MADNTWVVTNNDYAFKTLRDKNTVFTISNGYYALKGNVHEYKYVDYPATYISGVWGACPIFNLEAPTQYKRIYHDYKRYDTAEDRRSIANLPDPLMVELFLDNKQLTFKLGKVENFSQKYFLQIGLYQYDYVYTGPDGKKVAIQMMRFADMRNLHRAYMRYIIKPLNYNASIKISTGVDGTIKSNALDVKQYEVLESTTTDNQNCAMKVKSVPIGNLADLLVASRVNLECNKQNIYEESRVYNDFIIDAKEGQEIILDKFIVFGSSEDKKYGVKADLGTELKLAEQVGFDKALAEQKKFWKEVWDQFDVEIDGDDLAQLYMRFSLFHLMAGQPRHTDRLFMPVKLLTGDHYQGTAFYDTDLYIEPVFLATYPKMARKMIMFRYNILDKSREIARELGLSGAKYAWQVGPDGVEELGSWWKLREANIHLNGDIAYSIMHYYYSTGDIDFMVTKAVDVLVEISRFFLTRSEYDKATDTYSIDKVAGPDESHCNSKNNFYTNYLIKQCLLNTVDLLEKMQANYQAEYQSAVERLSIKENELSDWKDMAEKIVILYNPKTKLYEQAEGFFQLPWIPKERLERFKIENKPKAGMWFADLDKYCQINQPDVTMLFFLYRHHFDIDTIKANWEYYNPRNMNFSSMSFVVNSIMAKEVEDMDYAYKNFIITAGMDIDPTLTNRGDTFAGLHGTSAGGAWMAAVFGFGGINFTEKGLKITPKLPEDWKKLRFKMHYLGELLHITVTQDNMEIKVDTKKNIEFSADFYGRTISLKSGKTYNLDYDIPDNWWKHLNFLEWRFISLNTEHFRRDIMEKLDEIKAAGIRALLIYCPWQGGYIDRIDMEVWIKRAGLTYLGCSPVDAYKPHPGTGSLEDLKDLIKEAHKRGIAVVSYQNLMYCDYKNNLWLQAQKDKINNENNSYVGLNGEVIHYKELFEWGEHEHKEDFSYPGSTMADGPESDSPVGAFTATWKYFPAYNFANKDARNEAVNLQLHLFKEIGFDGAMYDYPPSMLNTTPEFMKELLSTLPKRLYKKGEPFLWAEGMTWDQSIQWKAWEQNIVIFQTKATEAEKDLGLTDDTTNSFIRVLYGIETADDLESQLEKFRDAVVERGGVSTLIIAHPGGISDDAYVLIGAATAGCGLLAYHFYDDGIYGRKNWGEGLQKKMAVMMNTIVNNPAQAPAGDRERVPVSAPDDDGKIYAVKRTAIDGSQIALNIFNFDSSLKTVTLDLSSACIDIPQIPINMATGESYTEINGNSYTVTLEGYGYLLLDVTNKEK